MRISELAECSGVPIASIKYYLREGLLAPGETVNATQARYSGDHVQRVRLIRSLTHIAGLSISQVAGVVDAIDRPGPSLFESLGRALSATAQVDSSGGTNDHPRAKVALAKIGQHYDPQYSAVDQLETALRGAEEAGLPLSDGLLLHYATHIRSIAAAEVKGMPDETPEASVEYAVIGTILYEPVLLALRRLAHQHLAAGDDGN